MLEPWWILRYLYFSLLLLHMNPIGLNQTETHHRLYKLEFQLRCAGLVSVCVRPGFRQRRDAPGSRSREQLQTFSPTPWPLASGRSGHMGSTIVWSRFGHSWCLIHRWGLFGWSSFVSCASSFIRMNGFAMICVGLSWIGGNTGG